MAEVDAPTGFPLYLVVACNNLKVLLDEFARSRDIRLLCEALLISCLDLKQLVREDSYWETIHQTLGLPATTVDYYFSDFQDFDVGDFLRQQQELFLRAAIRPKTADHLVREVNDAYKRVRDKDAGRFARRLRKRVDDLANQACNRYGELREPNGWPKEYINDDRHHRVIAVRCFKVVGGAVVAGADAYGALHFPPAVIFAKQSIELGIDIIENGLTVSGDELDLLFS